MAVPSGPLRLPPPAQAFGLLVSLAVLVGVATWLLQAPAPATDASQPGAGAPQAASRSAQVPVTAAPAPTPTSSNNAAPLRGLAVLPPPTPLQVAGQTLQSWPPPTPGAPAVLWLVPVGQQPDEALPLVAGLWQLRDAGHVVVPLPAAASEAETDALLDAVRAALASQWPKPPVRLAVVGARSGADAALRFLQRHPDAATAVTTPPRRLGPKIPLQRLALILAPFDSDAATRNQFDAAPLVQVRPLPKRRGPREDDWTILLEQRSEVLGWLVATLGPVQ